MRDLQEPIDDAVLESVSSQAEAVAGVDPAAPTRSGPFDALKEPYFAKYAATFALSMTGLFIRITALGFLVYELTEDPFKLGLMSFCQAAPEIILGPLAGAYIDRIDRKRLLTWILATQIALMSILTFLVASGLIRYWQLLLLGTLLGCVAAFDWPARLSLVPLLVDRSRIHSAVSIDAASMDGSRIIGSTIGGLILGAFGVASCFGITTLSFVPFLLVVLAMPAIHAGRHRDADGESPWSALMDGYRYIWREPVIRALLSVSLVPVMLGMTYLTMAPAIAKDVLDLGGRGLGYLLTANGIGSLTGTLSVAWISRFDRRGMVLIIALALFTACMSAYALSDTVVLSLGLIAATGVMFALFGTLTSTLIQTEVADAYRGRVTTAFSMMFGLTPIGALLAGAVANVVGVQWALVVNAALILLYIPYLVFATPLWRFR